MLRGNDRNFIITPNQHGANQLCPFAPFGGFVVGFVGPEAVEGEGEGETEEVEVLRLLIVWIRMRSDFGRG